MSILGQTLEDFKKSDLLVNVFQLKFYTGSVANNDFDDAQVLTQSGNTITTSGLALQVRNKEGSKEAVLIEQGKLKTSDTRFYIPGDIYTGNTGDSVKIINGTEAYFLIEDGVERWPSFGEAVYKKMYGRFLIGGSFANE